MTIEQLARALGVCAGAGTKFIRGPRGSWWLVKLVEHRDVLVHGTHGAKTVEEAMERAEACISKYGPQTIWRRP